MNKDEALRLALEALEVANSLVDGYYLPKEKAWLPEIEEAITAIKAALEAKDEPVALKPCAYESKEKKMCRKCGQVHAEAIWDTTPPQRKPLTDEEVLRLLSKIDECAVRLPRGLREFARAIEAAHGIKGEA